MGLNIALVGASGAVGAQFLKILGNWGVQVSRLRLLASSRSAGTKLTFRGETLEVEETTPRSFEGIDLAFVSATTEASLKYCPMAKAAGAVAIDDSSAFRLDPKVPLVIPEVNADDVSWHEGIISTPNCTAVPLIMVLHPLRRAGNIQRVVVSTYQSVSGAGAAAVEELKIQTNRIMAGKALQPQVFPHQIAFNALPAVDDFMDDGYSKEEWKMREETRKILRMPDLPLSATCVRVPVMQAHSVSATVEFERPVEPAVARALLAEMPGVRVLDDPAEDVYPHPVAATGADEVFVGRVRRDSSHPSALALWLSADNLRKGAALNAVQIADELLKRNLVGS